MSTTTRSSSVSHSAVTHSVVSRAEVFAADLGTRYPILLGPMAGACPVGLSIAVGNGGGMGACGALLMEPADIHQWADEFRSATNSQFQINLWIPDKSPVRNDKHESSLAEFLNHWGPNVDVTHANESPPDFTAQCEALLDIAPPVISSIMGLFDTDYINRMKALNIRWYANVSTVEEAMQAEAAGADAIVAKGFEAGGHSGAFEPDNALRCGVGTLSLVPAIADSVSIPIIASGGIADGRTAAAALLLGASAVQIGTGFLRAAESTIASAWSDAIGDARPEGTILTRAFSGRAGRSIATDYALAMESADAPEPAPYPVQRGLTKAMRTAAAKENNLAGMQAWAGQSAALAQTCSATEITENIWEATREILSG